MGREVRRVPADWQHPRDADGHLIAMHESFPYSPGEIVEGIRDGWISGDPPYYGVPVMPDWPDQERTHVQMYETTTEGTPISPVMATPEELARWLADNGASAFAGMTASYDHWLAVARGRSACSFAVAGGEITTGVAVVGGALGDKSRGGA